MILRPTKDQYFMKLAHEVAKRSIDPNTQHGCIAVDKFGAILSTGYNGPPRNVDDTQIPLTSPDKYLYIVHAEQNCICNAARIGVSLAGCIFYVTGIPCPSCMKSMYQVGSNEIVLTTRESNSTIDDWHNFVKFICDYIKIRYMEYKDE